MDIAKKIATLQRMKAVLVTLADRCEACASSDACPIPESLEDREGLE